LDVAGTGHFNGDVGGLSIFLPESDFLWMSYYRGEEDMTLEFTDDTHWDELMELLLDEARLQAGLPTINSCSLKTES
jgi:hypothetical protein